MPRVCAGVNCDKKISYGDFCFRHRCKNCQNQKMSNQQYCSNCTKVKKNIHNGFRLRC